MGNLNTKISLSHWKSNSGTSVVKLAALSLYVRHSLIEGKVSDFLGCGVGPALRNTVVVSASRVDMSMKNKEMIRYSSHVPITFPQ